MSQGYRSPRISNSYLGRIARELAHARELAPDFTTDRSRGLYEGGTMAPAANDVRALLPRQRPAPSREPSVLEQRHPDIARAVTLLWGHPEMNEYFSRLWLADGRHGPIDPEAMSELMVLARVHQGVTPRVSGRSLAAILGSDRMYDTARDGADPWSGVPERR